MSARQGAAEKRRAILDAAVRVFARKGFNHCRVADVADEAGVAYGLVYHYFRSKDAILSELFVERWNLMLAVIDEAAAADGLTARERLGRVADFIVESYARDPDVMHVVIVEVTRQANSFGRTHLAEIQDAFERLAAIVSRAQERGELRATVPALLVATSFYGAIEQILTGWIFGVRPSGPADRRDAVDGLLELICGGLETAAPAGVGSGARTGRDGEPE